MKEGVDAGVELAKMAGRGTKKLANKAADGASDLAETAWGGTKNAARGVADRGKSAFNTIKGAFGGKKGKN